MHVLMILVKRFIIATILYFMYIRAYENCFKNKAKEPSQPSNMFMITTARSNFRAIAKHKALEKINTEIKNYNFSAYVSARIYNQNFHQQKVSPARNSNKHEFKLSPSSSSIDKLSKSINLSFSEEVPKENTRKSKKLANHSFLSCVEPNSAMKKNNNNLNLNEYYNERKPQLVLDLSKSHKKQSSINDTSHKIRIKRNQSLNPEVSEKKVSKKSKNNRGFIHDNAVRQMMSNKFPNRSIIMEQKIMNSHLNETIELRQRFFHTEIERINPWVVRKQMEDWEQF